MSNYVISISREFGSGGRLIGKRLAAELGIPCYDRTIIQKTSEKSGLSPDFIARAEERARSREIHHRNLCQGAELAREQGGLLVLDEVIAALKHGLLDREPLQQLLDQRPEGTELVLTGRDAPEWLLERADYLPAIVRAWEAMAAAVHDNGFLGYVQGTGKEPKDGQPVTRDSVPDFEDYGLGCLLLAGSEVYKLR